MLRRHVWQGLMAGAAVLVLLAGGCQRQKPTDEGKTYSPGAGPNSGGASEANSSSGKSDTKPLDAPADTTNGRVSKSSDAGSSDATHGQVVAEPGAPMEHGALPPKRVPSDGH